MMWLLLFLYNRRETEISPHMIMFPDGPDSAQLITNEAEYLFDGKGSHFDGG